MGPDPSLTTDLFLQRPVASGGAEAQHQPQENRGMMTNRNRIILLAAAGTLALGACAKKAPPELPPAPLNEGNGYDQNAGAYDPNANNGNAGAYTPGGPGSQEDFVRSVAGDRVFFDTDEYNIDAQDAATLRSQAEWLQQYPNVTVVVEGHADERGTRDYNLALGERRATAAANYLASLGVARNRIRTISYGKERPQELGSNPQAWAQNRRAVTVTVR
tara:strand:- start:733 stop:1386 length:654 start_codon:yes stop_codon:yes gene_type:complete